MVEAVHSLLDWDLETRLKVKCKISNHKNKLIQSETKKVSESISECSALELKLDIDELQELYTMCTRPSVKSFIFQLIIPFDTIRNKILYCPENKLNGKRK